MPLFTQYTKPGVYTSVVYEEGGLSLFGDARIPVLIGEGQETRKLLNQELHRGSSSVSDETKVLENLSHQVTGMGRTYKLTYAPVVRGDGKGTLTNDPSAVEVYTTDAQGSLVPLRVTYLDGKTGTFMTQDILQLESELKVTYHFKREDTEIVDEDLSNQIPSFATYAVATDDLVLTTTLPGFVGNGVKLALTQATLGNGVSDALAVSGAGTNLLSIELRKSDNSIRTLREVKALVDAGIPTKTAGLLAVALYREAAGTTPAIAKASAFFTGGGGQNTNKVFKVKNTPVVDGSNGGVVTNLPTAIKVTVNNKPVQVASLEGLHGLFSLTQGLKAGDTLKVTYYTNSYQDTYDELPAENVAQILSAGYAPGREDFIDTVDYVLVDGKIHWGATAIQAQGQSTPGYTPFNGEVITTTMVDEKMFLRAAQGPVDGVNTVFTLEDVPTDGSGLSRATDNPDLIKVYVGTDPVQARINGPVRVTRLDGKSKTVTLYNPPTNGAVWVTSYRNVLNDHQFSLEVVQPAITGQGTYKIKDEHGNYVPVISEGAHTVTEADFAVTGGIIWPFSFSDMRGVAGQSPAEVITVTFQDDNLTPILIPALQATNLTAQPGLRFRATSTGIGPNGPGSGKPTVRMVSSTPCADAAAITVATEAITININREDPVNAGQPHPTNPVRSLGDIITLVTSGSFTTPLLGKLICELAVPGSDANVLCTAGTATAFSGGRDAKTQPYSLRYKVSSSRTEGEAKADGLGRTGGATTLTGPDGVPAFGDDTPGAEGYLGQTFSDVDTGIQFTIVDPMAALDYGYTELPSPGYYFRPGDKLVFEVKPNEAHVTSVVPVLGLYGLRTKVTSTYGMFPTDTAIIKTFNKAGAEPKIGEYYYVNLLLDKSDKDYNVRYFTNPTDIFSEFGDAVPENRLSLAAKLMFQNGAGIIAMKQVKKESGLETASDQTYMDAIADLAKPLPGADRKCDVIIPMSTSPVVQQFMAKHLNTQASPRMRGEAIGFIGMPLHATPEQARSLARSIGSERVVLVYPGGAILSVDINGRSTEFAVDGSFIAAALAGLYLNPANDVATTLTRQKVVGFSRLIKRTEEQILDLMAADGLCLMIERDGAFEVRHYVTTSTDNILKREPTTTTIVDYTRQRMRRALEEFIGRKSVQAVITDISVKAHSLLRALQEQEILESYRNLEVTRDAADPTVVHVSVTIKPVFSVLWISCTFRVTTRG